MYNKGVEGINKAREIVRKWEVRRMMALVKGGKGSERGKGERG